MTHERHCFSMWIPQEDDQGRPEEIAIHIMTPQALEIQRLMQEYIQEWVAKEQEEQDHDSGKAGMETISEETDDTKVPKAAPPAGPRPENLDDDGNVVDTEDTPNESLAEISLLSEAERSQVMEQAKKEVVLTQAERDAIAEEAKLFAAKELEAEKQREAIMQQEKERAKAELREEAMAQAKAALLEEAKKEAMAKAKEEMMAKLRAEAMEEARRELGLAPVTTVEKEAPKPEADDATKANRVPIKETEEKIAESDGAITKDGMVEQAAEGEKAVSNDDEDVDEIVDEIAGRISIDDIVNSEFE